MQRTGYEMTEKQETKKLMRIAEVVKALKNKGKVVAVLDVADPHNPKQIDLSQFMKGVE